MTCTPTRRPPSTGATIVPDPFPTREEICFDCIWRALPSTSIRPTVLRFCLLVVVVDGLVRVLFRYADTNTLQEIAHGNIILFVLYYFLSPETPPSSLPPLVLTHPDIDPFLRTSLPFP